MVSIENKEEIISIIRSDDVLNTFYNFLYNFSNKIFREKTLNDTRDIVIASFESINKNDKDLFKSALLSLSSRQPTEKSHWIYDDILIFMMLYCCKYFNIDCADIKRLISLRKKSENSEKNLITNAFINIANDHSDYLDKVGLLYWVFDNMIADTIPSEQQIKKIYEVINLNWETFKKDIFLRILATKALDLFYEYFPFDSVRITNLTNFEKSFLYQSNKIAKYTYYCIVLILLGLTILFSIEYFNLPEEQRKINDYLTFTKHFFGYGGLIPIFLAKKKIIFFIEKIIFKVFHYSYTVI